MKRKIENEVKIKFDDFLELGKNYFFNFEWIDPFSGTKTKTRLALIILFHFVGALFEIPVAGGEVGDMNAKIIGKQFQDLKYGDRFFYNHKRDASKYVPGLGTKLRKNVFR